MHKLATSLLTAAALLLPPSAALSQSNPAQPAPLPQARLELGQVRPMTVQYAKQLVAAAIRATCASPAGQCSGAFAVADDAGVIVYLETLDGVLAGGPELSMRKAKTSALWRRPTQVFQDAVNKGTNTSYADGTFPDMTTSPGGVPILRDGRVVGGFGQAAVGSNAAVKQVSDAVAVEAARLFGKQ